MKVKVASDWQMIDCMCTLALCMSTLQNITMKWNIWFLFLLTISTSGWNFPFLTRSMGEYLIILLKWLSLWFLILRDSFFYIPLIHGEINFNIKSFWFSWFLTYRKAFSLDLTRMRTSAWQFKILTFCWFSIFTDYDKSKERYTYRYEWWSWCDTITFV